MYLRLGFTDSSVAHQVTATVTGPTPFTRSWRTGTRPDRLDVSWQFTLAPAQTLAPGRYLLLLTVDGQPTSYPFTVVQP